MTALATRPRTTTTGEGRRRLVGGMTWLIAVELAEDRCECAGWCGQPHTHGRCPSRNSAEAPLHVIRAHPTITDDLPAAEVPLSELLTVCRTCHDYRATAGED